MDVGNKRFKKKNICSVVEKWIIRKETKKL